MRFVRPSAVSGRLRAPASKSHTQRAFLLAALADGTSHILGPSRCEDALAALEISRRLGAEVEELGGVTKIRGGARPVAGELDCGESGFCLRSVSAVAARFGRESTVTGRGSLLSRPVGMVEEPLRALGAVCETSGGFPPVKVRGPLRGGRARVDGSASSQFLSGLLMAAPLCPEDTELEVSDLKSGPYVEMTLALVRAFGGEIACDEGMTRFSVRGGQRYTAARVLVECDWSGAAFLLVAGAIAGEVSVGGLYPASTQADRAVLNALAAAGAGLTWDGEELRVRKAPLDAFEFDASDCPDLFPPLVALASACRGKSAIHGAHRLRHKESDRASALVEEFSNLGCRIDLVADRIDVTGGGIEGGEVNPRGDHRIAMACAVAGLTSRRGVTIDNEACVAKSYPDFFGDLESLTVKA